MKLDYTKIWAKAYQLMIHEPKEHELDNHEYIARCWSQAVMNYLENEGYVIIHESSLGPVEELTKL